MIAPHTLQLIDLALNEDLAFGDVTAEAVFPSESFSRAVVEARQDLVFCGGDVALAILARVDPLLKSTPPPPDGAHFSAGEVIFEISGPTRSILMAERTLLNFMQRLCGVATQSSRYSKRASELGVTARLVDTRKTTPGWRALEKRAVRAGGCHNHRLSLGEHVMLKDNHIAAAGSIERAVSLCRARAPHQAKIEVEVTNLDQTREALAARADVIMLDNMHPFKIAEAIALIAGRAVVEVSGGVTIDNLHLYAMPGIDVISLGALTHSAPAADISLEIFL